MATANIRISHDARETLRQLSRQDQCSMQATLEEAIELYRRHRLLDDTNRAFSRLKSDPLQWEDELAERRLWDNTASDGESES
jgi:thioredoxin-like negative regulator of GroEL